MKVEFSGSDEATKFTEESIIKAGGFVDDDGDINLVLDDGGSIVCLGNHTFSRIVRDEALEELIGNDQVERLVRPGETLTITF